MAFEQELFAWYRDNIAPRRQSMEAGRQRMNQMFEHKAPTYGAFQYQYPGLYNYGQKVASGGYLKEHAQNFRDVTAGDYQKLGDYFGAGAIGGKLAKGADLDMLKVAQDAYKRDVPKRQIYDATGWWKGQRDGKWKFEIDDSESEYAGYLMPGSLASGRADELIKHNKLYENYPELAGINTKYTGGNPKGRMTEDGISMSKSIEFGGMPHQGVGQHELQHGIQSIEGFSPGGSSSQFQQFDGTALLESLESVPYDDLLHSEKVVLSKLRKAKIANDLTAIDKYRSLPGEKEARNVQKRLKLTADDRRMLAPWLTENMK